MQNDELSQNLAIGMMMQNVSLKCVAVKNINLKNPFGGEPQS